MGDFADAMLDGTLCMGCGVYIGGEDYKQPLLCSYCADERRSDGHAVVRVGKFWQDMGPAAEVMKPAPKIACPKCGKKVKTFGLADHTKDMHPPEQTT